MRGKTGKKAYFIGIAGAGMSATAQLLKTLGWDVSGSDEGAYPPITTYLEQHGIPYTKTYSKDNVPKDADVVVVGKHAGLTREENEEVAFVYNSKFPIQSFPEVLHNLTKSTRNIVCAGSHGKSTCASILAWCLAEQDPSFFIGALPCDFETNARSGKGGLFILEGDEYPASNTDTTSKFLFYNVKDLIVTSLEHDHLNVFKTQEDYTAPFLQLIESLPKDGVLVMNGDDLQIQNIILHLQRKVITYSATAHTEHDWYVENIVYGEKTTFDLCHNNMARIPMTTTLLGHHNVENIAGTAALMLEKGSITPKELQEKVQTFTGVERRLSKRTIHSTVPLYEGFGSSHSKARSAIAAMKTHFGKKRLLVVFEPYAFSWRQKDYIHNYQDLFEKADSVYVYIDTVPSPKDKTTIAGDEIISHIKNGGARAVRLHKNLSPLLQEVQERDVILCLSSGALDGTLPTLVHTLEEQFSAGK